MTELGSHEFALGSSAVRFPRGAGPRHDHGLNGLLTRRELEVVAMLAEGETNARIARRLVVSEDTVKTHVKHILRKLGVHNRSQAVSRYFPPDTGARASRRARRCPFQGREITRSPDAADGTARSRLASATRRCPSLALLGDGGSARATEHDNVGARPPARIAQVRLGRAVAP